MLFQRFRVRRNLRRIFYKHKPEKLAWWEKVYYAIEETLQPVMCRLGKHDWDLCWHGPTGSSLACNYCKGAVTSSLTDGWVRTVRTNYKGVTKETYSKVSR